MNREEVSKLIPILQAFVDGKELRRKYGAGFVNDHDEIHLDQEYIIKPEPRVFWINPNDKSQSPRTGCWMTQEEYDQEEYETDKFTTKGYIKVREVIE